MRLEHLLSGVPDIKGTINRQKGHKRTKGQRIDKQVSLKSCPAILLYESIYRNKGIQARSQNRFETGCSAHLPLGQEEIFDILDTKHKQSGKIKAESIVSRRLYGVCHIYGCERK